MNPIIVMKITGPYEGMIHIKTFYTNKKENKRMFTQYMSSIKISHVNDYNPNNVNQLFYDDTISSSQEWILDRRTNSLYKYDSVNDLYFNTLDNGTGFQLIYTKDAPSTLSTTGL